MLGLVETKLVEVKMALRASIAKLLARGETTEALLEKAEATSESSQLFADEVERRAPKTLWQRHCAKGRWVNWMFPCVPLGKWLWKSTEKCRRETHCCLC